MRRVIFLRLKRTGLWFQIVWSWRKLTLSFLTQKDSTNTHMRYESVLCVQDVLGISSHADFASFWDNSDTAQILKANGGKVAYVKTIWNWHCIDFIIAGVCDSETGVWNLTLEIWQIWGSDFLSLSSTCTTVLSLSPLSYRRQRQPSPHIIRGMIR